MRAVLTTAHGDLSVLEVRDDFAKPTPSAGEVVIAVKATALNYHDIFTRRGMPGIKIPLPVIVGSDVAGVVESVGPDVDEALIGTRVLVDPITETGMIGETVHGGRADFMVAPVENIIALPDAVSFEDAAALPLAYGTAWRMLETIGQLEDGQRVLILGASGGVGVACVQIAKLRNCEVVVCASTQEKLNQLRDLGADHLVQYTETSYLDAIKSIYGKPRVDGGGGVDVAVNFTGGDTMKETQRCVRLGGKILTCGATAGFNIEVDARYWWTFEHKMLGSNGWMRSDLEALLALVALGKLSPVIDKVLPLEEAAEAERLLEDRQVVGKVVLKT